jgi:hypothetical protein
MLIKRPDLLNLIKASWVGSSGSLLIQEDVYHIVPSYVLRHSYYSCLHLLEGKRHLTAVFVVIVSCLQRQQILDLSQSLEEVRGLHMLQLWIMMIDLLKLVEQNFQICDPIHAVHHKS